MKMFQVILKMCTSTQFEYFGQMYNTCRPIHTFKPTAVV